MEWITTNGGVILAIGNQSATIADKMPIENTDRKQRVLDYMANHNNVTTAQLADYLELSQRTVLNILKELTATNLVVKDGDYRHTLVDARNKVTIIRLSCLGQLAAIVFMLVVSVFFEPSVWYILLGILAFSTASLIAVPAGTALLPRIVEGDKV